MDRKVDYNFSVITFLEKRFFDGNPGISQNQNTLYNETVFV